MQRTTQYRKAISDLQKQIDSASEQTRNLLRRLGEHLSYQSVDVLPSAEMKELHIRIQDLRRRLPESRQQVKIILQTVAGSQSLEREIREKTQQAERLDKVNQQHCQKIGRAAYQASKAPEAPDRIEADLLASIGELEKELAELEGEQETIQSQNKTGTLFRIFRETGRSLYVRSRLTSRRRALLRIYDEIGRKICDSEQDGEIEDPRLAEALAPFRANARRIESLRQEMAKLEAQREKRWSELKSLGAHRSHQKRVRELESEIQLVETRLEDACEALGTLFNGMPDGETAAAEAASIVRQIRDVERGKRSSGKQIERLQAAVQIDSLQARLEGLSARISRLEADIETRQREIETLHSQIETGRQQIRRLQRTRGSSQTLFPGEGE